MLATGTQAANPYFKDSAFAVRPTTVQMDLRPIVSHWQEWNRKFDSIVHPGG